MCGRFAFFSPAEAIAAAFGLDGSLQLEPRYNIAPTQPVWVIKEADGARVAEQHRWGLVPFWAKDPAIGNRMINARAETLSEKPSYRQAYRKRRCLIPADGFYEWQKEPGGKQPYFISAPDGAPFAFAGLWESWQGDQDDALLTCTIITTAANDSVSGLHHRMPVIVPPDLYALWLDAGAAQGRLADVLQAGGQKTLRAWPVSRSVNSPLNEGPELLESTA